MLKINICDFKLYLSLCPFLKIEELHQILKNISDKEYIELTINALTALEFDQQIISNFLLWQKNYNLFYIKHRLKLNKINLLCSTDEFHKKIFKEISNSPPFLFYQGNINIISRSNFLQLAIVGSRKYSVYGKTVVEKILRGLSSSIDILTISGLARGIDTQVHLNSLKYKIPTIAVLGSGLFQEKIYPKENYSLARSIINNGGLILSEFPPDAAPRKEHFPRRNRIISALSRAVLVIEAKEKSGALITARFALEQNKEVFAVPGNILFEEYMGTNRLIQTGAYPILDFKDIIKYFN